VMPIHGEYRMQAAHAQLASDAGVPASSIVIAENGDVVALSKAGVSVVDRAAGRGTGLPCRHASSIQASY